MSEQQHTPVPKWFNIVAGLALAWNLIGVIAFISIMTLSPESLAELPQAEQDVHNSTPLWANIAFFFAVFAGTLGCVALLLKKAWALPVLVISLVAVLVQNLNAFIVSDSIAVFGPGGMIMPIMVTFIAFDLIWLAFMAKTKSWIE